MAIVVGNLESREADEGFDCTALVTIDGRERPLTFRRYGNHPGLARRTDSFDPFAVALLVPAMLRGEPLVIEGDIDEILLGSLRGLAQQSLRVRLLVHHHVGAHGEDDAVFAEQYTHARRVADRLGLPLVGTR